MNQKLTTSYGLKFHPFRPDVPNEALFVVPSVDAFCRRVEFGLADGGFVMITGDLGIGKSIALCLITQCLRVQRDVVVSIIDHS